MDDEQKYKSGVWKIRPKCYTCVHKYQNFNKFVTAGIH